MYDTPVHNVPSLSPKPEVTISNNDLYDPPTSHDHDITSYDNLTPRLISDASPGLGGFHDNSSSDKLNPKLMGESSPSFGRYHDPAAESTSDNATLVSRGPSPSHDLSGARESFLNPVPQKKAKPSGHERAIYVIRLVLRILSLVSSVAILGVLLHVLIRYFKTRDLVDTERDTGIRLRVWPAGLKLWPTNLLLSAAAAATLLSFTLCMASFSKQIRRLTKRGHVFTLVVSAIGLVLWAAATIYFKLWDSKDMKGYDLWYVIKFYLL
jgi:hypothetical protein